MKSKTKRPLINGRFMLVLVFILLLTGLLTSTLPVQAEGTVNLTTSGVPYTQDFDSLVNTGTSSVIPDGWHFVETGTNANTTYTAGTGSANTGDTYSFGGSGSSERAFGGLLSGSLVSTIGASFTNNTGATINQITITYTGEQWRLGAAGRIDRLDFQLSTNATGLTTGTWTDYDELDFTGPITTGTVGALDGNAAANRSQISYLITGLDITSGAAFWIRWTDFNASGADDGLAVDDFSLTSNGDLIAADPVINEFSASTAGTDVEYIEIYGDPNTDYSAYTILEIEGDSGAAAGTVDEVIGVGTTDANGLYLVSLPANALENGTITLLLVKNFTGALNADLDADNDGIFDVTPWDAIVDSVAVNDGGAGDVTYGVPALGVAYDGLPFAPGGASRIPDGFDTDSASDWVRNDFDLAGIPGFPGTPDVGEAYNTPGALNQVVTPPTPQLVINEIDYDQPGTDTAEFVEIKNNSPFAVSLDGWTLELVNGNGSGAVLYNTITLPAVSLAAGDYFVVCANAATVANCDLDSSPNTDFIQNGAPDAVGLRFNGELMDAVSYEGNTGSPYTEGSGVGLIDDGVSAVQSISRCPDGSDTNQNNIDFLLVGITPGAANDCVMDSQPFVTSTNPANGTPDAPVGTNIVVNFNEPVTTTGTWFDITCTLSGAHTAVISGGPQSYTLDPDGDFINGDACTVTILAANVTDQDGAPQNMAANYVFSFSVADVCALAYTPIYAIQGSGPAAAINGVVTTQGVVVGDYEGPSPTLRGFYIQDPVGDGDPATSDGIFVFNFDNNSVNLGDVVRVTGTAAEFQDQTQISSVSSIANCGAGSVTPVDITFPVPSTTYLEQFEGMLVRLPQPMYVTEHFQLGRFGQVLLSANGRLQQPTNIVPPGAPALALQADNNLNKIILDDPLQNQNPDPILFGRGGNPLSASNTLRGGDTVTNIVGVLTYTWAGNAASGNAYRIRPVNALNGHVNFEAVNLRPTGAPDVGGTLKVVGMNLLNFFNTFNDGNAGTPGCFPGGGDSDCRGASSAAEFERQWRKTVAAILAMNPDVLGVNELENDGYGPDSSIQFLVDQLNAATAPGTYAFIDVDANTGQVNVMGTDAIRVALLYKPGVVTPIGQTAPLNSTAFVNGGDAAPRNRVSLVQAFAQNTSGSVFIVNVNHLKSKGSACTVPDAGDGQGNCNQVRLNAMTELMAWLATDPTGTGDPDILLVGDYNSYAMEDPIIALENGGFTHLIKTFLGPDAYSYVFDGQWGYLDHALATASLTAQVTGVADYHINADEPSVLDYLEDFKSPGQLISLYAPDEFRVSDHDPILIGLNLNVPPTVDAGGPYTVVEGGTVVVTAVGSDPDNDELTYEWDLNNDGVFETAGQSALFSAAMLSAPGSYPITVRVTDTGGLTATDQALVFVVYNFAGFFQPVQNLPIVNIAAAGSAVPMKFSLNGDKGLNIFAAGSPTSVRIACDSGNPENDVEQTLSPGGSALSYDPAADRYTYVWKTQRTWRNTCRQFTLQLDDGSVHLANFRFK